MLGQDVRAACEAAGHEPVAVPRAELDIADRGSRRALLSRASRPDVVVNCAAWTNVDGAESDRAGAIAINGDGAATSRAPRPTAGAWTVHISSDYVFNGTKRTPYVESDATGPLSAYGALEARGRARGRARGARQRTRSSAPRGCSAPAAAASRRRSCGSRPSAIRSGSSTIRSGRRRTPATSRRRSSRIAGSPPLGLLHVACAGQCSWFEFAREIVAAAGVACEVRPITTAEYPLPAPRPAVQRARVRARRARAARAGARACASSCPQTAGVTA